MDKRHLKVTATSNGVTVSNKAENHEFIIDEPVRAGGENLGPNPLQATLGALAACENVTLRFIAREMEFNIEDASFEIEGVFDPRGYMGVEGVRPYFESVSMHVTIKTDESEERMKELQQKTEARCPIYTMMKAANVEMYDTWTKA